MAISASVRAEILRTKEVGSVQEMDLLSIMVGTISVLHLKPGGGRSDIVGMQANGFASPSGYTSNRFSRMSSMIFLRFTSRQNAAM